MNIRAWRLRNGVGGPPAIADGERYVGDYAYDRRVSRDHADVLMALLRDHGFSPPEECAPGLHEGYCPNVADAWLVHKRDEALNGMGCVTWLPRRERPDLGMGGAESWGRGNWYRPIDPATLSGDELSTYHFGADRLLGIESGRVAKVFGQKLGRAMRWNLRRPERQLAVASAIDLGRRRWWSPPWEVECFPRFHGGTMIVWR